MKSTITSKASLGFGVSNALVYNRDTGSTELRSVTSPQSVGSIGECVRLLRKTAALNRGGARYDVALFLDGRRITHADGMRFDGDAQELADDVMRWDLARGVEVVAG